MLFSSLAWDLLITSYVQSVLPDCPIRLPVEVKGHKMLSSTSVIPVMGKKAPVLCELSVAHGALAKAPRS